LWPPPTTEKNYFLLGLGIIIQATALLARDNPAQINMTTRNPNTKASPIDLLMAALTLGARPAGIGNPASLIAFALISCRTAVGSDNRVRPSFSRKLKAFPITIPRIARASPPATRATALLTPEAVPARS